MNDVVITHVKKPRGKFGNYRIVPNPDLAKILGTDPLTPLEAMRKYWAYIKENKLEIRLNKDGQ